MLAARGAAEVALVDVNEAGLVETARLVEAAGARASVHRLDLSDVAATETWFQAHGDVDILHNNAGVVSGLPQFPDVDAARIAWIVNVHVTSLIAAPQIAVHALKARGCGVIVNTVSTLPPGPGSTATRSSTPKAA